VFRWSNGEVREAVVVDVDPARRLVLRWLDDDGVVSLELEETHAGTTLRVVEATPDFSAALGLQMLGPQAPAACPTA
jgi:uncharacterized protein YndB with AHSA1/START domain